MKRIFFILFLILQALLISGRQKLFSFKIKPKSEEQT